MIMITATSMFPQGRRSTKKGNSAPTGALRRFRPKVGLRFLGRNVLKPGMTNMNAIGDERETHPVELKPLDLRAVGTRGRHALYCCTCRGKHVPGTQNSNGSKAHLTWLSDDVLTRNIGISSELQDLAFLLTAYDSHGIAWESLPLPATRVFFCRVNAREIESRALSSPDFGPILCTPQQNGHKSFRVEYPPYYPRNKRSKVKTA